MFRKLLPKTTRVGLHANQSSQLSATVKHFLDQRIATAPVSTVDTVPKKP